MTIPEAVRATVLRRLASLDRPDRAVLMRAAVIGPRFDVSLLVAAAARPRARVCAALADACALELIVEIERARERYAFRHALTRDIVYAEWLDSRLRPVHRRIVRALERAPATAVTLEDLAYHGWAARDVARSLRYNELAGDRAAGVHAGSDARAFYVRAQSLLPFESADRARLAAKLDTLAEDAGVES